MKKAAFALFLLLAASSVVACDCKPLAAAPVALERSAAVVDGTVISVEDRYVGLRKLKVWFQLKFGNSWPATSDDGFAIRLKVHEAWKGEAKSELIMYTRRDEAACGFPVAPGHRYLIYARLDENEEYDISF